MVPLYIGFYTPPRHSPWRHISLCRQVRVITSRGECVYSAHINVSKPRRGGLLPVTDVSNLSRCLILCPDILSSFQCSLPIPGAEQRCSVNEIHYYFWLKPGCGEDTRAKGTSMSTSKFVSCRLQSPFSPDLCCPQANRILMLHLNC